MLTMRLARTRDFPRMSAADGPALFAYETLTSHYAGKTVMFPATGAGVCRP